MPDKKHCVCEPRFNLHVTIHMFQHSPRDGRRFAMSSGSVSAEPSRDASDGVMAASPAASSRVSGLPYGLYSPFFVQRFGVSTAGTSSVRLRTLSFWRHCHQAPLKNVLALSVIVEKPKHWLNSACVKEAWLGWKRLGALTISPRNKAYVILTPSLISSSRWCDASVPQSPENRCEHKMVFLPEPEPGGGT